MFTDTDTDWVALFALIASLATEEEESEAHWDAVAEDAYWLDFVEELDAYIAREDAGIMKNIGA